MMRVQDPKCAHDSLLIQFDFKMMYFSNYCTCRSLFLFCCSLTLGFNQKLTTEFCYTYNALHTICQFTQLISDRYQRLNADGEVSTTISVASDLALLGGSVSLGTINISGVHQCSSVQSI